MDLVLQHGRHELTLAIYSTDYLNQTKNYLQKHFSWYLNSKNS